MKKDCNGPLYNYASRMWDLRVLQWKRLMINDDTERPVSEVKVIFSII